MGSGGVLGVILLGGLVTNLVVALLGSLGRLDGMFSKCKTRLLQGTKAPRLPSPPAFSRGNSATWQLGASPVQQSSRLASQRGNQEATPSDNP